MVAETFRRFVHEKLRPHRASLVSQLRQLIRHRYPPQVASLEFEVFADGFTAGFPVRTYFLDSSRTEFFLESPSGPEYPSPIDPGLLDIPAVYLGSEEAPFLDQDPQLDTLTLAAEVLIPWFAEVWHEAGGASFPLDCTVGIHDGARRFDLRTHAWLDG